MNNRQITVLTGNHAADVCRVISLLGGERVNIRAHCLVDNGDGHCKLRMIVSEPEKAIRILQENRFAAVVNDVVIIETDDRPGGLSRMLEMLEGEHIQIDYTYTAASEVPGVAVMVFRFSDNLRASHAFNRNGIKLLKDNGAAR